MELDGTRRNGMELGLVSGLASRWKVLDSCSVYKATGFWFRKRDRHSFSHTHSLPAYCDSLARLASANSPSLHRSSGWSRIQQGYTYRRTALGWSRIQQSSLGGNSAHGLSSSAFISLSLIRRYIGGWVTNPTSIHYPTPIRSLHPFPFPSPFPFHFGERLRTFPAR